MTDLAVPAPTATPQTETLRTRAVKLVAWAFESFGPLLVFWAALQIAGLVAAIVTSVVTGALLVARTVVKERRVSPFTAFVAASVVFFGMLDLRYQSGFFIKLEPALGNVVSGMFFLGSVLWLKPVVIEIAERGAGRPLPEARGYLTAWTVAWALFFFARAAGYVWMAYNLSLVDAIKVRATVGPISFGSMFVLEFGTRVIFKGLRRRRLARGAAS